MTFRSEIESSAGSATAASMLPHSTGYVSRSVDSAEPAVAATVICTLGMHRSGTSLVSRLLNLLGVYLGEPASISHTGWDNPKGFWEHHGLALLNDEILDCFGGRWDQPPALPARWTTDPRLAEVREKARQLLRHDFAGQPVWGWKDPRTCLTIPFWQELIGSMRYVVCLRNPCAVLASLSNRDGISQENAERLWLTHVESTLRHTSGQPRMFVFYEDVLSNWRTELRRLAAFIGRPSCADDPRLQALAGEFLEDRLCHHRMSMVDLAGHQRISFATKGLYLALRGHGAPGTSADGAGVLTHHDRGVHRSLDLLATRALETWNSTMAAAAERQALAHDHQAQAAVIAGLDAERNHLLAERNHLLVERDRLAVERNHLATERDCLAVARDGMSAAVTRLTAERNGLAAASDVHVRTTAGLEADLQGAILERDRWQHDSEAARQVLQEIHASCAWKLVAFSRRLIVRLMPAGTWRRQVFSTIVAGIARQAGRVPRAT